MFNLSTFEFAINDNFIWDVISNSEQKFSIVRGGSPMHACNKLLPIVYCDRM